MERTREPPFETEVVGRIRFLQEQDGIPEREFKEAVVPVLKRAVQRAYLARIQYADTGTNAVALCLRATGSEEPLVKAIGAVFSPIFGARQHLDIIFLNEDQERELAGVCRPFFESAT